MNVGSGANVTTPASSTVHVPSPGTTTSSISPSLSVSVPVEPGIDAGSKFTELTLISPSKSESLVSTVTSVGVPTTPD